MLHHAFEVLHSEERIEVIRALRDDDIAIDELARRMNGETHQNLTCFTHVHIPKLRDAHVVEQNSGRLEPGRKYSRVNAVLAAAEEAYSK